MTLDTFIVINAVKIEAKEAYITLDGKLPSGMEIDKDVYFGWYITNDGETVFVDLKFRNEKGEIVTPNSSNVIPDGKYTVELDVGNNYYVDFHWDLAVGNINEKNLTVWGILAVVVTVLVMVAAIVTSVIVVNNRKKNEVID